MPDVNTFTIRSNDPEIVFRAYFGDGAPLVIDGYGGWTVINRARDVGITEWAGRNPMAIELPFVIDNWMSETTNPGVLTEAMVGKLERLCGLGDHDEPPICSIFGQGAIPHDERQSPSRNWVIENVTWDRSIELRSGDTQRRLRCGGTILLRQFVESDPLTKLRKKNKKKGKRGGAKGKGKIYIVKAGDSLTKIAAKKNIYGDASKWKKIADANNIRDPRKIKVGQHLRIP